MRTMQNAHEDMDTKFESKIWEDDASGCDLATTRSLCQYDPAQASQVYGISTADGASALLNSIANGRRYAGDLLERITSLHSAQIAKNQFGNFSLLVKVRALEKIEATVKTAATIIVQAYKLEEGAAVLHQSQRRQEIYEILIKLIQDMRARLSTLSKIATSLYDMYSNLEGAVRDNVNAAAKLTVSIHCIDSEWRKIQGLRLLIKMALKKEALVEIPPFMVKFTGRFKDGTEEDVKMNTNAIELREREVTVADAGAQAPIDIEKLEMEISNLKLMAVEQGVGEHDAGDDQEDHQGDDWDNEGKEGGEDIPASTEETD